MLIRCCFLILGPCAFADLPCPILIPAFVVVIVIPIYRDLRYTLSIRCTFVNFTNLIPVWQAGGI